MYSRVGVETGLETLDEARAEQEAIMSGFRVRALVFPTDFSDCSRHAGQRAAEVARHFGARLHVIHVDAAVGPPTPASRLPAAAAALGSGLDVTTATTVGVPAHAICAYAQRIGADLIVMGTHGRTGVSRAVLGSVAEAVVRHSRCPVMTIPAQAATPINVGTPPSAGWTGCVVCGKASADLMCERCRGSIRGEATARCAADTTRHGGPPGS
jgi:nucleotide-binding universal stress UspA family protein